MTYEAEDRRVSIALAGDTLLTRHLTVYREDAYLKLRELLHAADARFCNLEGAVHRYLSSPQSQRQGGGTYMTVEPDLIEDLKWLGINMLACGSSHADDYGWAGVVETIEHLDRAGMVHAGSGRHLAEARTPAYLETPRGRIGLVAATGQFNPHARAGEQRTDSAGHPGVNALRHAQHYEVDSATLDDLRRIGRTIGLEAEAERRRNLGDAGALGENAGEYRFLGTRFKLGNKPAVRSTANKADLEANLRQVAAARAMADRVIVSLHNHDQGGPTFMTAAQRSAVEDIADYAIDFAHRSIDAGADVFVGHGPQVPYAVEIYNGKPVFHGIGTFVFQLETLRYLPSEAYERYDLDPLATPADFVQARYAGDTRGHTADPLQWEQVFAICDFAGDELTEIRLYPLDLGFGKPRPQRGRPMLAGPELADRILTRLASLSAKRGTHIKINDGMGVIN